VAVPPTGVQTRSSLVSVLIVTYNSAAVIGACLDSLFRQDYEPLEIILVDNASNDGTRELLRSYEPRCRVLENASNTGFCAAQNQAIREAHGEWLLCLNPDVILQGGFVRELTAAADLDAQVGALCGKMLRWNPGTEAERSHTIDSTGMYFLSNLRHLDRGAEEQDQGQYEKMEYVFGATGAAALYRRAMVEDVSVQGEFFDEAFFAYREDADLAWRAQLMGWKCIYTPRAVGWHGRRVTPERREQLPLEINWHSIKNRFLMRIKNISGGLYARCFLPTTFRDLQIVGYCLLVNQKLLSSLAYVWKNRKQTSEKRREIQSRRKVSDRELAQWFSRKPRALPLTAALARDPVSLPHATVEPRAGEQPK
jgi:GT2 family glycosyltransferase